MFIETLEFTIPVDLCDVFSSLKNGPQSNVEFPASVNSYGTTQDASVLVALRANKLTLKVDGVSSSASIVSKSECKTLKLSVFDVDTSNMPQEQSSTYSPVSSLSKRRSTTTSLSSPSAKSQRTSFTDFTSSPGLQSPVQSHRLPSSSPNHQLDEQESSSFQSDNVVLKIEPEDLIEIDPDDDQGYDQNQSGSSSFQQNLPHVSEYTGPSASHGRLSERGSLHDFPQYRQEDDGGNDGDFSNDGLNRWPQVLASNCGGEGGWPGPGMYSAGGSMLLCGPGSRKAVSRQCPSVQDSSQAGRKKLWSCPECSKIYASLSALSYHRESIHEKKVFQCLCGKVHKYRHDFSKHRKSCLVALSANNCCPANS